ncbi:MAG TPA: type II toxin-antitoxin system PrlF family antitoxin [Alloacidobacterium sp.]|nr:type II toxin-antitoxin system PrlF family antitoxin [Alloacidobacterium sp.]
MGTPKAKSKSMPVTVNAGTEYRGKQTKTGNSSGFRFEGALFKSHPEFNGEVTAYVLAPGRLLVTADTSSRDKSDPAMEAFLAFLSRDIATAPHRIAPLDKNLAARMDALVSDVEVSPDEDLGIEVIL